MRDVRRGRKDRGPWYRSRGRRIVKESGGGDCHTQADRQRPADGRACAAARGGHARAAPTRLRGGAGGARPRSREAASRSPGRTPLNAWTALPLSAILGLRLTNRPGSLRVPGSRSSTGARSPYRPAIGPGGCLPGGPVRVPPRCSPGGRGPCRIAPRVRRGPLNHPPCLRRPHRRRGPMELRQALASADWHRARDSPAAPGRQRLPAGVR